MKPGDYEAVREAPTREDLREALSNFAARMDFPLVNALLVSGSLDSPDLKIGAIGNTPSSFLLTHSDLSRVRTDPVMHRLQADPTPFTWDQGFYARQGKGHLWEDQAPHGYRVGIAASLDAGSGQRVFVGVDRFDKLPTGARQLTRLQADIQLLAVYAHVAAKRILSKPVVTPTMASMQLPRLAPREIEVLKWTDEGKTIVEIGLILGIGPRTVTSYLELAKQKLGVYGKKETAAKVARALGLF
jgi:DNA-binding CsgD family transcriptional regulator